MHRIVSAIDCGYVVNPDTCRAQAEGNVIFCIGQFYERHHVKDGRVVESNFHDFRLPALTEMPKVEVIFPATGGFWGGHGEPARLRRARDPQRGLRRDRQAHPLAALQAGGTEEGLSNGVRLHFRESRAKAD